MPIINQLKSQLEEKGYLIDDAVGQSHFKCDLAVRESGKPSYSLAILIDRSSHYATDDILEQYCQKPSVLKAFGWKLQHVYSKDWLEQPERVMEKIMQKLEGNEPELEDELEIDEELKFNNSTTEPEVILEVKSRGKLENEFVTDSIEDQKDPLKSSKGSTLSLSKEDFQHQEQIETSNSSLQFKRYEFSEGSSNKFWEIAVDGFDIVTRYGRLGNKAQENRKTMGDQISVLKEELRLIGVKTRKGYRPV